MGKVVNNALVEGKTEIEYVIGMQVNYLRRKEEMQEKRSEEGR